MLRSLLTLGVGEGLARFLNVVAFLVIARTFGKYSLGEFGLAATISSYTLLAVQQGFDVSAIRDACQSPGRTHRLAANILGIRIVAACLTFGLVAIYALHAGIVSQSSQLLLILSLRLFATAGLLDWAFKARERMAVIAIASIASQIAFLCGALLARDGTGILGVAWAQVAGEAIATSIIVVRFRKEVGMVRPNFEWKNWVSLFRESWPVCVSMVMGNLMYNFDVFALSWFQGKAEIGIYLACYRFVTVFAPLLSVVSSSIYPAFSRVVSDRRKMQHLIPRVLLPVLAGLSVVSLFLSMYAGWFLRMLYGSAFENGAPILQVMAWVLPVQGSRAVLRQVLFASRGQRNDALSTTAAVITNIGIDLMIARHWGALGCALSTLASEIVLLLVVCVFIRRHFSIPAPKISHFLTAPADPA